MTEIYAVDGTLAFGVGPNGDRPGVRITMYHPLNGSTISFPLDEDQAQEMALAILGTAPDDMQVTATTEGAR